MLEETDQIDMAARTDEGIQLIITDAGMVEDDQERMALLLAKLRTYAAYVTSSQFASDLPNVPPDRVTIKVMCRTEPSAEMRQVRAVRAKAPDGAEALAIPVEFEVFQP